MSTEAKVWTAVIGCLAVASAAAITVMFRSLPEDVDPLPPETKAVGQPTGVIGEVLPGKIPDFQLTDQQGRLFGLEQLRGKVWIVNFMFTRCTATCPTQAQEMAKLQQRLQGTPVWSGVRLLSVSVDPEHDQPDVMSQYAQRYGADSEHWRFLTGSREQIWNLCGEGFKLSVREGAEQEGLIVHDSKFIVVDRMQRIRGYFDSIKEQQMIDLQRCLDHVLPEMPPPPGADPAATHLAQPPEIIHSDWLQQRFKLQQAAAASSPTRSDFRFVNRTADSQIDFDPQIVDEQRWRLRVNHYDHGNGVAAADVDGDGLLDLYFLAQASGNALYRGLGKGRYDNITDAAGVAVAGRTSVAGSFADIDNDGDPDLMVTTVRGGNFLFQNDGGVFQDITGQAGIEGQLHSSGAVFFDYDRDGLLDLFICNVGKYTIDEQAEVRQDSTNKMPAGSKHSYYLGTGDAFAGHLKPKLSERSVLYRNLGEGKFVDVTEETGLVDLSWTGDATPLDANQDGWPDLYVLNMQGPDHLYLNQQGQKFVSDEGRLFPRTPWGAMGVKSFDFNRDGRLDLLITDMHSDMSDDVDWTKEKRKSDMQWPESFLAWPPDKSIFGNALFLQQEDGSYKEVSDEVGAENYWPWGVSVDDFNADGFDDVFIASSMCLPYRYGANSLLLNRQGLRLEDMEFVLGVEPRPESRRLRPWFASDADGADKDNPLAKDRSGKIIVWSVLGSRSSLAIDIDQDGDLDIVTNDFNSPPLVLTSNLADEHTDVRYLKVALRGTKSNRDGLGAVVKLSVGDAQQLKVHDGKSGYLSQSLMPLYFGLGSAEQAEQIEVRWPSGVTQTIPGPIRANQTLEIVEPK